MSYIVKMPKLGLEMEQGTVLEWTVERGDAVSEGEMIAEVESEKSIGEVEAREDGTVRRVYAEEGDTVPPGTPIGIFAAPDADIADLEAEVEAELEGEAETATAEAETAEAEPAEASEAVAATAEAAEGGGDGGGQTGDAGGGSDDVKASPRAQKRAEELNVDLTTVQGTGFDGAITEDDVETAAEAAESDPAGESATDEVKASPRAQKRAEELGVDLTIVDGTGFEGAITEDDVEAAAEAEPPVETAERQRGGVEWLSSERPEQDRYDRVTATADPAVGDALFETMEAVRTAFEQRVTMTDVMLVLASATLTDHPMMNGTFTESTHQITEPQHIALVADINGSVAGVVPDAANKSLTEIVDRRQSVDGDSEPSHQATFTLTNAAETDGSGRLINPPAVAALEIDPTGERAVPSENGVTIHPLVTATLTYDTRAVGAGEAQAFLDGFFERAQRAPELVLGSYRGRE
ncbi:E3 binding domain-containing protein [Haloarcula sp. S1AR25-5A]|uniref:E3 binding domain-containing protein n=1 Tax=Haloarcula terrestris TaxID=2950533 RepID=A0AAE4JHI6_9EURY|nr:E3 binding domain-containing protein [Haloarcula terrestris]MDS0220564.1 E3 binding domain-containing protein [Haloarcula terrestris]